MHSSVTRRNIGGTRSSRENVKTAATSWIAPVSRIEKVVSTKRMTKSGAPEACSAREEGIDPQRRGANFLHGVAVDFVVTPVAGGRFVGLFAKNDFINQASGGGVCRGHPRNVHTGEFLLQALDQAHKIPYGEDVMSGENGKGGGGADGCVDRMIFD